MVRKLFLVPKHSTGDQTIFEQHGLPTLRCGSLAGKIVSDVLIFLKRECKKAKRELWTKFCGVFENISDASKRRKELSKVPVFLNSL